ncbi:MAG: Rnase Y domain-containing protein, partial [Candidatus Zixiibacteriota bacterium]
MMESVIIHIAVAVIVAVISAGVAWFLSRRMGEKSLDNARQESQKILREAQKEAEIKKKEAVLEAREDWLKVKSNYDKEIETKRRELENTEKSLDERNSQLNKKIDLLENRERDMVNRDKSLHSREKGIEIREKEIQQIIQNQNEKLQKIAQMTPEEAKKQLMDNMIADAKMEAAAYIKEIRDKAEQDAEKEAREIILSSIYRCAADHTVETTVSVVNLPNDEMKGRIIGREGRNIRAFETCTGIDVIVDDTPEAVILSGYDPVRREIARMALEKLISDGRIHPTRIEEVVEKAQKEMDVIIREVGEQACFELG